MPTSPGEGMGYYALGLEVAYKYNEKKGFWDNARRYHKKIGPSISNKKAFGDLASYLQMDSNIYEALSFKKIGGFVKTDSPRYNKLNNFANREDVVVGLLKRAKIETFDSKLLGPAITNLGRMDFPKKYGSLELDRLIMQPGGAPVGACRYGHRRSNSRWKTKPGDRICRGSCGYHNDDENQNKGNEVAAEGIK